VLLLVALVAAAWFVLRGLVPEGAWKGPGRAREGVEEPPPLVPR
jgi:hypothetical protein